MKLWGLVLLGLGAASAASGIVVAGAHKLAARHAPVTAAVAPAAPPRAPLEPAHAELTDDVVGTFHGMKDELLLENMRAQPIREVKFNKGGSSVSLRVTFEDGSRAAFKPEQNNPQTVPRKEIAAYRLNRLLGLNNVPPAVVRSLHRDEIIEKLSPDSFPYFNRIINETIFDREGFTRGEMSYWIPTIVDTGLDAQASIDEWTVWLTAGEPMPPAKASLMAQLSTLLVFDTLTNNSDRFSGGNLMGSPDGRVLYYMDNTFGFQLEPQAHERCRAVLVHAQKFSKRLVGALRSLDAHAIRRAFEPEPVELSQAEIQAVLARRDVVLRYVDQLVAEHGADQVLVLP